MTSFDAHAVTWRPMLEDDLQQVMAIETGAYSHPWTLGNFLDSLRSAYALRAGVLRPPQGAPAIVAYSVVMPGVDADHLLNLTVDRAYQRQGLGCLALRDLISCALGRGTRALWLEVRASNAAALALYQRFGFQQTGRRRDYYPAVKGREDAVLMNLTLPSAGVEAD
jgi:[ribosomal protein S18]-alanine N-acetyltransferase